MIYDDFCRGDAIYLHRLSRGMLDYALRPPCYRFIPASGAPPPHLDWKMLDDASSPADAADKGDAAMRARGLMRGGLGSRCAAQHGAGRRYRMAPSPPRPVGCRRQARLLSILSVLRAKATRRTNLFAAL